MPDGLEEHRFERIYREHYDDVLRYCARRSGPEIAQDAAAETFTIAWRRFGDLPKERTLPWLYGIAWRVLSGQRRSVRRFLSLPSRLSGTTTWNEPSPERTVVRRSEEMSVIEAIGRLSSADQEVIRLSAWEELSREELGIALGCSPNAATKRLSRALDHLATALGTTRERGSRYRNRERRGA